jgi:transcription elongation factor Elf1
MAEDHLEFRFTCPLCGGTTLELPVDYNDDSIATCGNCGSDIGRWGDIKAKVSELQPPKSPTPFKGFTR